MVELKLRRRSRLRKKEVSRLKEDMEKRLGCTVFSDTDVVETAEVKDLKLILVNTKIMGIFINDIPFLSLRGVLEYKPTRCYVVVDSGAVRFVYNGADVMAPGITDADREIVKQAPVWVKEERYKKPLAIGMALMDGEEMVKRQEGKAIKTILHVGDKIWHMDE